MQYRELVAATFCVAVIMLVVAAFWATIIS